MVAEVVPLGSELPCKEVNKMSILIHASRCPQNHRCPAMKHCPTGAITQNGYAVPVIDPEKCIECGKCVMVCPTGAMEDQND